MKPFTVALFPYSVSGWATATRRFLWGAYAENSIFRPLPCGVTLLTYVQIINGQYYPPISKLKLTLESRRTPETVVFTAQETSTTVVVWHDLLDLSQEERPVCSGNYLLIAVGGENVGGGFVILIMAGERDVGPSESKRPRLAALV
ncbi:hypothetical protein J6590_052826 [Homalodisca vitripennis]|nr:hypothetical protein J6590_052826 [Homalodisca vitripennis]